MRNFWPSLIWPNLAPFALSTFPLHFGHFCAFHPSSSSSVFHPNQKLSVRFTWSSATPHIPFPISAFADTKFLPNIHSLLSLPLSPPPYPFVHIHPPSILFFSLSLLFPFSLSPFFAIYGSIKL